MKYNDTRGGDQKDLKDILIGGTSPTGGLYVPETIPQFSPEKIAQLKNLSYTDFAFEVLYPFMEGSIKPDDLKNILRASYGPQFESNPVAPLVHIDGQDDNRYFLELFHGPTLAFKDYALQFVGRLFSHFLKESGEKILILVATSGDTGGAAIEAFRGMDNIDIVVMHPHNGISEMQRKQMAGVIAPNVFNIALEGAFDDCQNIMKAAFKDEALNAKRKIVAVNSVNWARLMTQLVYHAWSSLHASENGERVNIVIPSGNYGNMHSAWVAKQMGFPVGELVVATNQNDALVRFFETGEIKLVKAKPSHAPSMDINIPSNFERFLHVLYVGQYGAQQGPALLKEHMEAVGKTGVLKVPQEIWQAARQHMQATRCSDAEILEHMREYHALNGNRMDPHTAAGYHALVALDLAGPTVVNATAHVGKFAEADLKATGSVGELPPRLKALQKAEERYTVLPNNYDAVRDFVGAVIEGQPQAHARLAQAATP